MMESSISHSKISSPTPQTNQSRAVLAVNLRQLRLIAASSVKSAAVAARPLASGILESAGSPFPWTSQSDWSSVLGVAARRGSVRQP